jgi:hypothetical protein
MKDFTDEDVARWRADPEALAEELTRRVKSIWESIGLTEAEKLERVEQLERFIEDMKRRVQEGLTTH